MGNIDMVNSEHKVEINNFSFNKVLNGTMEEIRTQTVSALSKVGFGVVTEIDMHDKFKDKLGIDILPYKILGVCNPAFAYKAMQAEPNIGIFLPCKVLLKQQSLNKVEVVILNPEAAMSSIQNKTLDKLAGEVTQLLKSVAEEL